MLRPLISPHVTPEGIVIRRTTSSMGGGRAPSIRRILAAVIAATSTWVAYAVYTEAASGHALDDRVRILASQNDRLRVEVAARQREIGQANGNAWLEEEARRLGYVKPGEHIYILTPAGQPLRPAGGVDYKNLPTFAVASPSAVSPGAPSTPAGPQAPSATPTPSPPPTPHVFTLPTPAQR